MMGKTEVKSPASGRFDPIVLLKDVDIRRKVQGAFKSTTREAWNQAHSSKTKPPEVGKYKPKYDQIETDLKAITIRDIQPNVGEQRKKLRGEQ